MAAQLPKSLRLQVGFFARGFRDACRFQLTIETLRTNKAIQNNVIKSSVVQVLLLASVFAFDHLVLPLILSRRDVDGLGGKASLYYEVGLHPICWLKGSMVLRSLLHFGRVCQR
jgi:etoposide-induced 2.4 mRNA